MFCPGSRTKDTAHNCWLSLSKHVRNPPPCGCSVPMTERNGFISAMAFSLPDGLCSTRAVYTSWNSACAAYKVDRSDCLKKGLYRFLIQSFLFFMMTAGCPSLVLVFVAVFLWKEIDKNFYSKGYVTVHFQKAFSIQVILLFLND